MDVVRGSISKNLPGSAFGHMTSSDDQLGDLRPTGAQAALGEITSVSGGDDNSRHGQFEWMVLSSYVAGRNVPGFGNGNWLFCHTDHGVSGNAGWDTFGAPAGMPHTSSEESQGSGTRGVRVRAGSRLSV